jgi:hypothetical protein
MWKQGSTPRLLVETSNVDALRRIPGTRVPHFGLTTEWLAGALVQDALMLGVERVTCRRWGDGWMFVESDENWILRGRMPPDFDLSVSEVFNRFLLYAPETSAGDGRHEIVATAFAKDAACVAEDIVYRIKGKCPRFSSPGRLPKVRR